MAGIAAMAIAYVLSQFFRSFLAVLTPALMADLAISKAELSLASGAWFASFALMQFAVGMALDRYGPKRTTALMFGVFGGGGALLFAAATAPWMIILALGLIGAGCAPMLMAGMFVFARSFPPARLAVLTACFMAVGSAGNVVGTTPLAAAADAYGWRGVIFAIGLFAIAVALALLALVRDPPRDPLAADHVGGFAGFLAVIRISRLWPVIPLIALGHAPMIGILGLWSGPYLSDVYGADALTIGHTTFFMSIAVVGGSLLYGLLDTVFARKWLIVLGNASAVLVLAWPGLAGLGPGAGHCSGHTVFRAGRPVRLKLSPDHGACPQLHSTSSYRSRHHPAQFLLHWRRRHHPNSQRRRGDHSHGARPARFCLCSPVRRLCPRPGRRPGHLSLRAARSRHRWRH